MAKRESTSRITSAALGGVVAGLVMALIAMVRAGANGLGFWLPMKSIAATYAGVDALIGGGTAAGLGLVTHVVVSAGVGALFGVLLPLRPTRGKALALAVLYGVFVWAAMTFLVLPTVNEVMLDRVMLSPFWWFVLHTIFGLVLGIVVPVRKAEGLRVRRRQPTPA